MKILKFFLELICFVLVAMTVQLYFDAKTGPEVAAVFIKCMGIPFGIAWAIAIVCSWIFDVLYKNVKPLTIRVW